jgi:hypothetical protein
VLVQKPVGTANVWKPLTGALAGNHGTTTIPGYAVLGIYRIRIAAVFRGHVLAFQEQQVHVFGTIPLGPLLRAQNFPGALSSGVHSTPTAAFPYVMTFTFGDPGRSDIISDEKSACNAVRLEFVGDEETQRNGAQLTMSIVQERAEPVATTVGQETIGVVEAHVPPGQSWAVNLSSSGYQSGFSRYVYVNGSAHCDLREQISTF